MSDTTLTLWVGDGDPPAGEGGTVCRWRGYRESPGVRSLLAYVEQHGERLRATYVSLIQNIGATTVHGRSVVEQLALGDGPSFWWMTSLVSQSPWDSATVVDVLRLFALDEIADETRPAALRLVGGDARLTRALSGWCARRGLRFIASGATNAAPTSGLRGLYDALPMSLKALTTIARHAVSRWRFRGESAPPWSAGSDAIFFSSYFIHLDEPACRNGTFRSRHWEALPDAIHAAGRRTNWLQTYVPSSTVPTADTAVALARRFNAVPARDGAHGFIDAGLSLGVVARVMRGLWTLSARAQSLRSLGSQLPNGIARDSWALMEDEWEDGLRGARAAVSLLWIALYDDVLGRLPRQSTGLYLLENQPWERAFIHAWRAHGHGRLIAVAHATVRFWDLRYCADPRVFRPASEGSGPLDAPQPDVVAVNGPVARRMLEAMRYPAAMLAEVEALRYQGLHALPRRTPRLAGATPLRVLLVTDYHADGTRAMLRLLAEAAAALGDGFVFTVKPHPNLMVDPAEHPGVPLRVETTALTDQLARCDVVYASTSTSASIDAVVAGLPVIVALDDATLNFSPLRGMSGVHFVSNGDGLARALRAVREVGQPEAAAADAPAAGDRYFHLDPALPRWKRLLSLSESPDELTEARGRG